MDTTPSTPTPTPPGSGRAQLTGTAILTLTMLAVSGANYVLNLVTARLLPPAAFGDANLAVNLVLASAAVAATLQLATARSVAAGDRPAATRRRLARHARVLGGVTGVGLAGGAWWLQDALQTSTPWLFVLVGAGLPVYFGQAVARGALQGQLRLGRLAASYGAEAAARLVIAVVLLLLGAGVTGVAAAIALSFVASALVAGSGGHPDHVVPTPDAGRGRPDHAPTSVAAAATVLLVGQVAIANGDVVLAKFALTPATAGTYAGIALFGRALFFVSWSVVHATFPLVARAGSDAVARRRAVRRAVGLVTATSLTGILGLALFGPRLTPLLLGGDYADGVDLLVPYAVATALFALANLLASVDLAAGRRAGPVALLLGALLQGGLLVAAGDDPAGFVRAQVVAMAVTVTVVAAVHLRAERRCTSSPDPSPTTTPDDPPAATSLSPTPRSKAVTA